MPFASGTAKSPSMLMQAINTLMVANGWTKLKGETDNAVASPKAARYWRCLVTGTYGGHLAIDHLAFASAPGGAQLMTDATKMTTSAIGAGTLANLIGGDGSGIENIQGNYTWWGAYDFTNPTIIRSMRIKLNTWATQAINIVNASNRPHEVRLQWSHDGFVWTTMKVWTAINWSAETTDFTLDFDVEDGYVDALHVDANTPRRSGEYAFSPPQGDTANDIFMWQGPGYDPDRRVHVMARGHYDLAKGTHWLEFGTSVEMDIKEDMYVQQVGARPGGTQKHIFWSNPVPYWIYVNSSRLIVITRSGSSDYASTYVGFLGAFDNPVDYPFPLACLSSSHAYHDQSLLYSHLGSMADPGEAGAASWRRWDGVWRDVQNRVADANTNERYHAIPNSWTWPYHFGAQMGNVWPYATMGGNANHSTHWMNQIDATEQGEVPMLPVIVVDYDYGAIGSLQGVYAIASGGIIAPEQVITVGGVNHRVFCNRSRRLGNHWFAVRED